MKPDQERADTWLEEIKDRHAGVASPPDAVATEPEEDGKDILVYSGMDGPVATVDALDTGMHEWIAYAHSDEQRLIEEVERLRANYRMATDMVDLFMAHNAMTMNPRMRVVMTELQHKLRGLS